MKISKHLKFASVSRDGNQSIDKIEKNDNGKPFSYDLTYNLITKLAQSAPTFHLARMKFTSIFLLLFVFFYESFCVELSSRHKLGWVRILFHFEFILSYLPIFYGSKDLNFHIYLAICLPSAILPYFCTINLCLIIISKITLRRFIMSLLSIRCFSTPWI